MIAVILPSWLSLSSLDCVILINDMLKSKTPLLDQMLRGKAPGGQRVPPDPRGVHVPVRGVRGEVSVVADHILASSNHQ